MQSKSYEFIRRDNNTSSERGAFSVDDFCAWASIGRSKFYQEVKAGRLKLRKIGRKSVVTTTDALDWLSSLPQVDEVTK